MPHIHPANDEARSLAPGTQRTAQDADEASMVYTPDGSDREQDEISSVRTSLPDLHQSAPTYDEDDADGSGLDIFHVKGKAYKVQARP